KKGLEPPHPCEYMDLNHARLPIPPLRHARCVQRERLDWQQFLVLQRVPSVSNLVRVDLVRVDLRFSDAVALRNPTFCIRSKSKFSKSQGIISYD
ncbi:MAG TPA: hypothetical protein VHT28_08990, partial [Silvibacterium sp.]|nr:hypothetical protein [Silvibacterium sp.]